MKSFAVVVAAAALAGATTAGSAAVVMYQNNVPLQATNWTTNLTLPQWDPAAFPGQTLVGVKITLSGTVEGDAKAESLDAAPSVISVNLAADIELNGPNGLVVSVLPLANTVFNATAYDGTSDFGGTSGFSQIGLTNTDQDDVSLAAPGDDLSAYIGAGTVAFGIGADAASVANGPGNVVSQFRTDAGAIVTVEYTYIPAPGAVALLGLGGLVARRRR